ncbi:class I adenylate-forming enzyme family protein [Pararhodobacter zhoushanensis]|uniref:class I adenylate-forming enzyme family protein n=1 Tax=Pararhodobacter zhoushanensis TaxID=2479545 RepID=UPI001FE69793|nr:AMP-binding protein [Pararhodobacter zhoushanensis]
MALDDGTTHLTYHALDAATDRFARCLLGRGLRTGDRIGLALPKSTGQVVALLGALRAGIAVVPLDAAAAVPYVTDVIARTRPALILGDHPARHATPAVPWLPALADDAPESGLAAMGADQPVPASTEAIVLFTSGSTGRPKAVAHTHRTVLAGVQALRQAWDITASDRLLHILPMTHAHGLIIALMPLLMAGARLDLRPRFDPADVVRRLPMATCFMGVPFHYAQLLDHPGFNAGAATGIRLFTSGSAPLPDDLRRSVEARTHKPLLERYGMTETLITTANTPDAFRPGSVGRALPGADLRIRDLETGELVAPGGEGEVEVRGDFVFEGYQDDPSETALAFGPDGFSAPAMSGSLTPRASSPCPGGARMSLSMPVSRSIPPRSRRRCVRWKASPMPAPLAFPIPAPA